MNFKTKAKEIFNEALDVVNTIGDKIDSLTKYQNVLELDIKEKQRLIDLLNESLLKSEAILNVIDKRNTDLLLVENEIQSSNDKLSVINAQISEGISTKEEKLDVIDNKISSRISELEKLNSIAVPKINELNDREKVLMRREKDIEIIIDRYKKKYQDKGTDFRI